jgi:hypothetical protein
LNRLWNVGRNAATYCDQDKILKTLEKVWCTGTVEVETGSLSTSKSLLQFSRVAPVR